MSQRTSHAASTDKRERILAAAEKRFAAQGYEATRLEDIGAEVGVGRSVVLYHFGDKRGLYAAVLADLFDGCLSVLRRALAGAGDLPSRIENAVRAAVDFMAARPAAARIAMREAATDRPELRGEIQRQTAPLLDLIEILFDEGERTRVFRPDHPDPLRFVSVISGSTLFYVGALPALVESLDEDHLAPDAIEAVKGDLVEVTRRLLGIRGPRALYEKEERT